MVIGGVNEYQCIPTNLTNRCVRKVRIALERVRLTEFGTLINEGTKN